MPENRRRFRNPVAHNPLLRKGGPHQKSRSAERRNQRHALEAELDNWREELEWQNEASVPEEGDGTDTAPFTTPPCLHFLPSRSAPFTHPGL